MNIFKFVIFVLFFELTGANIYSQNSTPAWSWAKNATAGTTGGIFTDPNGNSYTISNNSGQINIVKYDSAGTITWTRTASGTAVASTTTDIAVDGAGNYFITGTFSGSTTFGGATLTASGSGDIFTVKYNPAGTVLWAQREGGTYFDYGNTIAVDASGNCYIGGSKATSNGGYSQDAIIYAKYNSSGTLQWVKTNAFYFAANYSGNSVKGISVDNFGNTYLTGTWRLNSVIEFFIGKYDPYGNQVWFKTSGANASSGNDIATDSEGNSYVTGNFHNSASAVFGSITLSSYGNYDIFVAKYNSAGQAEWAQKAGDIDVDYGYGIAIDALGNCYTTGSFQQNANFGDIAISNLNSGISDIFVTKYDTFGGVVWVQKAGDSGEDAGNKIGIDGSGHSYLTGYYSTSTNFGTTTLNGIVKNRFLAKIGTTPPDSSIIYTSHLPYQTYNAGGAMSVAFTTSGNFNSGNLFSVQLSGPSGSFFYPTVIGSGQTSPISCAVPSLAIPAAGYRVRVIASHPSTIGTNNGSNITINGNSQQPAPSWTWAKTETGGAPDGIFTDPNGNSYMVSNSGGHVNIVKYDSTGTLVWTRTGSSGAGTETPNDLAVDASGNYYVVGTFTGSATFGGTTLTNLGQADIFTVKYSSAGTVLWAKNEGGVNYDTGNTIAVDASGNCYVGGSKVNIVGGFSQDAIIFAKYNSSGTLQWVKTASTNLGISSSGNLVKGISVDNSGNTYLTGSWRISGVIEFFIGKYDPSGNQVWFKTSAANASSGNDIVTDAAGNSYVTGNLHSTAPATFGTTTLTSYGDYDIFVIKYNAAGQVVWAQNAGGFDADYGYGIAIDAAGNSYVTGAYQHSATFANVTISNYNSGVNDVFVAKYNPTGSIIWVQRAGENGQDAGSKIGLDGAGNCYIAGYFTTSVSFGTTTLNGTEKNRFIGKIGLGTSPSVGNPVVLGANFCAGAVAKIVFPVTGIFNTGNVFTLQLSNASGSFSSPVVLGTINSSLNTDFYVVIPPGTPPGSGYRFRVTSSSPAITGNNNGINVSINQPGCDITSTTIDVPPLVTAEYFFDTDPGVGHGVQLGSFASADSISLLRQVPVTGLASGFHNLFLRIKDNSGIWGMYEGRVIYVQPVVVVTKGSPVVSAEYFFDTDPGVRNGTAVASFVKADSVSLVKPVSVAGLSQGFHNLYIRTKDSLNAWSMYEGRVVYIQPSVINNQGSPVISAESFFDTDPGVGNGTAIASFVKADSISLLRPVSVAGLSQGFHNLYIRTKDSLNRWSMYEGRVVYVQPPVVISQGAPVVSAEYFFDTDPGVRNGTPVTGFAQADSVSLLRPIPVSGLSQGFHNLFIRAKDSLNAWSLYEGRVVYIQPVVSAPQGGPIVAAEYFFNNDPGVRNGVAISGITNSDSISSTQLLPSTGLTAGYNKLSIRTKDSSGVWSLYETRGFTVCSTVLAAPSLTGNSTVCVGYPIVLNATAVVGATSYFWKGPNGFTASSQNISTVAATTLMAGVYKVMAVKGTTSCDTGLVASVNVVIDPAIVFTQNFTKCSGESVTVGIHTYTSSGNYIDTLTAQSGCDSTVTTNLTVNTINTSVSQTGAVLTAATSGAAYQWLNCSTNFTILAGETGQSYSVTGNGNYAVSITQNGCSDTSACIAVSTTGVSEANGISDFIVYPLPAREVITIAINAELIGKNYFITDATGRLLLTGKLAGEKSILNVSELAAGIYIIRIQNRSLKMIK